ELEAKLKQAVREAKEAKGIEFIEELKTAHERIQNRIRELNHLTLKDAEKIRDEIVTEKKKTEESILDIRKDFFEDKYEKFNPDKCTKGSSVFVIPLEAEGIVESIDLKNKKLNLIFGNSIRSKYSFKDVFAVKERKEHRQVFKVRPVTIEPSDIPLTIQTTYNTVDLRGMRVDEALSKLDSDLDSMMAKSIKTAVVIHGHGTGALKDAVRSHLKFSYYVLSSRSGQQGEGGDGVTIAALK
ncbi:MAG TPA: Smr/MutS family protein, partial [Spirochaetota bacterium]|nr:Smr/MutS family protein [Spirochaetota bacterium]